MNALERNPRILSVEKNTLGEFTVVPSDYYFPARTSPPSPPNYQWGMQMLRLPWAWDYVKGNAYLGIADSGLETNHPDLKQNFRSHFSHNYSGAEDNSNVEEAGYSRGHGTHTSGIMAAASNNGIGVAGACWNCSLMMSRTSTSAADLTQNINHLITYGAQAINFSLTKNGVTSSSCATAPYQAVCSAIAAASEADLVLVASSGNFTTAIGFPANQSEVIAVGGVNPSGTLWLESFSDYYAPDPSVVNPIPGAGYRQVGSNTGLEQDLVAPAQDVLSTFYTGYTWNTTYRCGDGYGPNDTVEPAARGYGTCTGTSMAAPHVTGIVGLLRSANPLLTKYNIQDLLISKAVNPANPSAIQYHTPAYGYGIPNAEASVKAALGVAGGRQLNNRLTPLFDFYSEAAQDFFYTTVPQMAGAAVYGTMAPQPLSGSASYYPSGRIGVPGYSRFPLMSSFFPPYPTPTASVYVLTTANNPTAISTILVPLYRLSYQGNYTGTNPSHIDHTYATDSSGIAAYTGVGYKLDGIEGYVYSKSYPQPPGTVRLMRKYNPSRHDHAIFPEGELNTMIAQGYTQNSGNTDWIGYVYLNSDFDGDGLVDGFEGLAGTCAYRADTDYDGRTDGQEVTQYPYTDPGRC